MSSFTKKQIKVQIKLEQGHFFTSNGGNALMLEGHRVEASIQKIGTMSEGTHGKIAIYGMLQEDMNQLSLLMFDATGLKNKNLVTVWAGDVGGSMANIFSGYIMTCWADYSSPDAALIIDANPTYMQMMQSAEPHSYNGDAGARGILSTLAAEMGLTFEWKAKNDVILSNPYLSGTLMNQARELAESAKLKMVIDGDKMVVMGLEQYASDNIPFLSPQTGMIGYPRFNEKGIAVKALFDPSVTFMGRAAVQSSITLANGIWGVWGITYTLESEKQDGAWFMDLVLGYMDAK